MKDNSEKNLIIDENVLDRIIKVVQEENGHDFNNYKTQTLLRRLDRRLHEKEFESAEMYLNYLKRNQLEQKELVKEFLINVTKFFRDNEVFEYIKNQVLPRLFQNVKSKEFVRVWVCACASGEEAYTWAILLDEYIVDHDLGLSIKIFASDIDDNSIEKARDGVYSETIKENLPQKYLDKYFVKNGNSYQVKKKIRENILFAKQDVVSDPPYSKIDIISCRNFLIYLNNSLQNKVLDLFNYSLNTNGYLILGTSETIGRYSKYYDVMNNKFKIFQKRLSKRLVGNIWNYSNKYNYFNDNYLLKDEEKKSLKSLMDKILLEKYTPTSVIIDGKADILYVKGKTSQYLEIPTGEISNNIINVAKEGLKIPLANIIRKVSKSKHEEIIKHIYIDKVSNQEIELKIRANPINIGSYESTIILIVFQKLKNHKINDMLVSYDSKDENYIELEKELSESRESLQNTIEELEATNEELQSTNEELISTNEELETSKEELQSVNEELVTTNTELNNKIDELSKLNNDLNNFVNSTAIATVFLDINLNISRFTPNIKSIYNFNENDIGRNINDFNNNLDYNNLDSDISKILEGEDSIIEKEVYSNKDIYYWMQLLPYIDNHNKINGIIITFTDISEKKYNETKLKNYREHLEEIVQQEIQQRINLETVYTKLVNSINSSVIIYKVLNQGDNPSDYIIEDMNYSALKIEIEPKDKILGKSLKDIRPNVEEFGIVPVLQRVWKTGEYEYLKPAYYEDDRFKNYYENRIFKLDDNHVVAIFDDVSEKIIAEHKLAESEKKFKTYIQKAPNAFFEANLDGRYLEVNKAAEDFLEYSRDELFNMSIKEVVPKYRLQKSMSNFSKIKNGEDISDEVEFITKYGKTKYGLLSGTKIDNSKLIAFVKDITKLKQNESELMKMQWLLDKKKKDKEIINSEEDFNKFINLKNPGFILDNVGYKTLSTLSSDIIDLLDSSLVIVEKNGQYAYLNYKSKWCKMLFAKSYSNSLYGDSSKNNVDKAINSKKWLCYESKKQIMMDCIRHKKEIETKCISGMNIYAIPIKYKNKIVGAISISYGMPDISNKNLEFVKKQYEIETSELKKLGKSYKQRPPFIINLAKRRLESIAKLIEEIISRKQIEKDLIASEKKYRQLIETTGDLVLFHNENGEIQFVNKSFMINTNYQYKDVIGKNIIELVPNKYQEDINSRKNSRYHNLKDQVNYTIELIVKNGNIKTYSVNSTPLIENNSYKGTLLAARDITKEKELELRMESLEKQRIRAQKMETIGTLAGGIAHEFNNLLYIISGNVEYLQEIGDISDKESLDAIMDSTKRGSVLVKQLLAFSRKDSLELKTLNINDEIKKIKKMLERVIPKNINIQLDLDNNLKFIKADEGQIEQIITNLCINSRDAMECGGKLIIRTTNIDLKKDLRLSEYLVGEYSSGNKVVVSIIDDGKGISKERLNRIFDPFFTTKEVGKGTGLGLSVIYGIVKNHGGFITYSSEEGKGTEFHIYFPISTISYIRDDLDKRKIQQLPKGNETILVIDDEDQVLKLSKKFLEPLGYKVLIANNCDLALRLYKKRKNKINLVLLDINMPKQNGLKTMQEIKDINSNQKVVIASGYSSDLNIKDSLKYGALDYIKKPFSKKQLVLNIRKWLDN